LEYFTQNHLMESVLENFLYKIKSSEMRFSDINPSLLEKSFLRRAYDLIRSVKRKYFN
jgi:hypothetical protein